MSSFNSVILLANATRDPETKFTPNGAQVTSFSVAVNEKFKKGEETIESVHYFDCVAFGKLAETIAKYVSKGDSILISGKLAQRRWQDKESGSNRSKVEVAAQSVTFMPKRQASGGGHGHAESAPETPVDESSIPF